MYISTGPFNRTASEFLFALGITIGVPAIGYISLGTIPALMFLIGYLSGLVFWLFIPTNDFRNVKLLYWITFFLFILHRVEEKLSGFFDVLADMTGVAKPSVASIPVIALVITSVGAWLAGPLLASKNRALGTFLVWSFFASMGITELAHFILPLFRPGQYGYFPGMISVIFLAPVAWYAMIQFSKRNKSQSL